MIKQQKISEYTPRQDDRRDESKSAPVKKFKTGLICVNIWENKTDEYNFLSASLDISYKDKQGEWRKTNGIGTQDIPKLILMLEKAYEYSIYGSKQSEDEEQ